MTYNSGRLAESYGVGGNRIIDKGMGADDCSFAYFATCPDMTSQAQPASSAEHGAEGRAGGHERGAVGMFCLHVFRFLSAHYAETGQQGMLLKPHIDRSGTERTAAADIAAFLQ